MGHGGPKRGFEPTQSRSVAFACRKDRTGFGSNLGAEALRGLGGFGRLRDV